MPDLHTINYIGKIEMVVISGEGYKFALFYHLIVTSTSLANVLELILHPEGHKNRLRDLI